MSDNTIVILDDDGAAVLAAINAAFDTINTLHSGATAPAELVVGMLWADTGNSLLKRLASTGPAVWTTLGTLAANMGLLRIDGSNAMTGAIDEASAAPASAATLTITGGNLLQPTGTTGITALGTAQAGAQRTIRFTTALTLTHNATNLIIPGAQSITTAAGDIAEFRSLGSGNWLLCGYVRGDGTLLEIKAPDLAAAATTNLATVAGNYVVVTNTSGATVITALGTAPAGVRKVVTFSVSGGSVNMTCNTTSLILPGTANAGNFAITDGDSAVFHSLGSGNWRMTSYQRNSLAANLWVVQSKSANYTVVAADKGAYFLYSQTGDVTLSLPAVGTAGANFVFAVSNRGTAGTKVTIDPNGADLIDGIATTDLYPGSAAAYICDGTGWRRMDTGVIASAPTFANNSTFNASGSWTVPADTYTARFTAIGNGGGSGGNGSTGTAGGTGGSVSISGPAGTLTANGGGGGAGGATGTGGVGGTGSGGTTNITGGAGGAGGVTNIAGAGGGGGFAQKTFTVTPGDVYTITINAAGTAGVAGGTVPGTGGGGGGGTAAGQSGGANNGESGTNTYGGAGGTGSGSAGAARVTVTGTSGSQAAVSTGKESAGGSSGGYGNNASGAAGVSAGAGASSAGGASTTALSGAVGGAGRVYVEW